MLLNVARLHREKGHSDLLTAFEQVRARHPGSLLVLAGEGRARNAVREEIRSRGLKNRCGWRVFVRTSVISTTLPTSVSSHRIGKVSRRRPGGDGCWGSASADRRRRQPRGDRRFRRRNYRSASAPAQLARATLRILSDDRLADSMKRCARERAGEFSVERQVRETEQLYVRLARGKGLLS